MNQQLFNETQDKIGKVCSRILNSKSYYNFRNVYKFDEGLEIERFTNHSIFKVTFKDVQLGNFHSDDKTCPEWNIFYDSIYEAIEERKKKYEKEVLDTL